MKLHTLLNFGGNCAEAFRFYEKHLDGKIEFMMTFDQMPEPKNFPPGMENAVLHASLKLGQTRIMANDVPKERFQPIRSAYLTLTVESDAEAERIHSLLADGGEVQIPIQETFFATRFGSVRDRFGASWMIIHERPRQA